MTGLTFSKVTMTWMLLSRTSTRLSKTPKRSLASRRSRILARIKLKSLETTTKASRAMLRIIGATLATLTIQETWLVSRALGVDSASLMAKRMEIS